MKANQLEDERISSQKRRIQSDAFEILVYCLLISLVIQFFIMRAPFSQYAVELFCMIGLGIYTAVRYWSIGIDTGDSLAITVKKTVINGLVSGIIGVVLLAVLAGERNIGVLVLVFICITVIYAFANMIPQFINKKRLKQINDELDCQEMDK